MNVTRTFAPWVQPLADKLREDRQQVGDFARTAPVDFWDRQATNEGWTNKDLLAHIGKGNDMMFQELLRELLAVHHLDKRLFSVDTDAENRRRVEERREWPVATVIAEVEEAGEEMQDLLSQLTDEHEHYRQADPPFILSGFLELIMRERHDLEHLAQLRDSLETVR